MRQQIRRRSSWSSSRRVERRLGKITSISEITGMDGDVITMQEIFSVREDGDYAGREGDGRFRATASGPSAASTEGVGDHLPADMFEGVTEVRLMLLPLLVFVLVAGSIVGGYSGHAAAGRVRGRASWIAAARRVDRVRAEGKAERRRPRF